MKNQSQLDNSIFSNNGLPFLIEIAKNFHGFVISFCQNEYVSSTCGVLTQRQTQKISRYLKTSSYHHALNVSQNQLTILGSGVIESYYCFTQNIESIDYFLGIPIPYSNDFLYNYLPIGILQLDRNWLATRSNAYLENLFGANQDEFLGRRWLDYLDEHQISKALKSNYQKTDSSFISPINFTMFSTSPLGREIILNIELIELENTMNPDLSGYILLIRDITAEFNSTKKIKYAADHDKLTSVSNRNLLADKLERSINDFLLNKNDWVCIFVDINEFKHINDVHGHWVGDQILIQTAQRLTEYISHADFVCRNGGDEFIILKKLITSDIKLELHKILTDLDNILNHQPYNLEQNYIVTSSLGATVISEIYQYDFCLLQYKTIENFWLAASDTAMYQAKTNQNHTVFLTDKQLEEFYIEQQTALWIETELEINSTTHFQPIFKANGNLFSLECLSRFTGRFADKSIENLIKTAKKFGKEVLLFDIFLSNNIKAINELETQLANNQDSSLHDLKTIYQINIESYTIGNELSFKNLVDKLSMLQISPQRLFLEISERDFQSTVSMNKNLLKLRYLGYKISMDDFGVGKSNLKRLLEFSFDQIKLDKSFLDTREDGNLGILKEIVCMMQNLNQTCVIEGVETKQEFDICKDFNVELFQGYYLSYPLEQKQILALLIDNLRSK